MPTQFIAGFGGQALFAGTNLNVTSWKASLDAMMLETTNTSTNGFKTFISGLQSATATVNAYWDVNANPQSSPNLTVGTSGTVKLYVNSTSFYSFLTLINKFEPELKVDGVVAYTLSLQITGSFTYPN